jgi:hypothetical protein
LVSSHKAQVIVEIADKVSLDFWFGMENAHDMEYTGWEGKQAASPPTLEQVRNKRIASSFCPPPSDRTH